MKFPSQNEQVTKRCLNFDKVGDLALQILQREADMRYAGLLRRVEGEGDSADRVESASVKIFGSSISREIVEKP